MAQLDAILHDLASLSPDEQARVGEYIAFLRWQTGQAGQGAPRTADRPWQYNFLEHFAGSDVRASRNPAGMEVKTAEAIVGGDRRPALWQHPPVDGESQVEYHVPIPIGLRDLRLRFVVGIRDGAQDGERLVAFRVRVGGWQVWSRAAWPTVWEAVEVPLPLHAGNVLRLSFATDGLGSHKWAWAVWGEPVLMGELREDGEAEEN